jgi:hypothetical protein
MPPPFVNPVNQHFVMLALRPAIVKPNLWGFCAFDPMLIFTRCTTAGHMAPLCEKNAQTKKFFGTFAK